MSSSGRTLTCSRRSALAAGLAALIPGCTGSGEERTAELRFSNRDSVAHSIHATFRGSEDDEPVQQYDLQLDPGAARVTDERLKVEQFEGGELVVTTAIDDANPDEHSVPLGFSYLGVSILSDGSINFSTGTA